MLSIRQRSTIKMELPMNILLFNGLLNSDMASFSNIELANKDRFNGYRKITDLYRSVRL